jgi:hypothetical protein
LKNALRLKNVLKRNRRKGISWTAFPLWPPDHIEAYGRLQKQSCLHGLQIALRDVQHKRCDLAHNNTGPEMRNCLQGSIDMFVVRRSGQSKHTMK